MKETTVMKTMNSEIKKVVNRVKTAQERLNQFVQGQEWVDEARRYAEKQRHEVKKLLTSDLGKVRTFIEKERKELEKFQKQIPGEVKKFRTLIAGQRKELTKLLARLSKANAGKKAAPKKARKTTTTGKKKSASGSSASAGA